MYSCWGMLGLDRDSKIEAYVLKGGVESKLVLSCMSIFAACPERSGSEAIEEHLTPP
jgi:hypothetical protein